MASLNPPTLHGRDRELLRDPLNFFLTLTRQYGDVVCYRPAPEPAYLINHPDYIRHVLVDNSRNYTKATYINQMFKTMVGDGLITSEGETWRRQRRMMQPAFSKPRLAHMDRLITAQAAHMLDHWQAAAEEREPVLLASEIAALTLSITTQALFGVDLGEQVNQVGRAVDMGGSLLERPSHPRFKAGLQIVEETVQRIIASSRQSAAAGEQDGNLLNALMQAREADTGLGMDDASLRDQVITLLLAGYETTASALTWTFYLLSQHPEVADRLRQAANSALDGRTPAYADLPALEYAGRVFEESMRLYPPAWVLGRVALADDQLGEYFVPAGTVIAISPYAIHRHPGFWEDPERFDPERFTPEHLARRPYFAYIPFGAGPRYCIGKTLAMLEGQLILPMVIRRFDLRLLPDHEIKPEALFVLRPDRQMKMQLLLPGGNRPAA